MTHFSERKADYPLLPGDVCGEVLHYLPGKDRISFGATSKIHSDFVASHLRLNLAPIWSELKKSIISFDSNRAPTKRELPEISNEIPMEKGETLSELHKKIIRGIILINEVNRKILTSILSQDQYKKTVFTLDIKSLDKNPIKVIHRALSLKEGKAPTSAALARAALIINSLIYRPQKKNQSRLGDDFMKEPILGLNGLDSNILVNLAPLIKFDSFKLKVLKKVIEEKKVSDPQSLWAVACSLEENCNKQDAIESFCQARFEGIDVRAILEDIQMIQDRQCKTKAITAFFNAKLKGGNIKAVLEDMKIIQDSECKAKAIIAFCPARFKEADIKALWAIISSLEKKDKGLTISAFCKRGFKEIETKDIWAEIRSLEDRYSKVAAIESFCQARFKGTDVKAVLEDIKKIQDCELRAEALIAFCEARFKGTDIKALWAIISSLDKKNKGLTISAFCKCGFKEIEAKDVWAEIRLLEEGYSKLAAIESFYEARFKGTDVKAVLEDIKKIQDCELRAEAQKAADKAEFNKYNCITCAVC